MKKNLLILVCLCLISSIGFAKSSPKSVKAKAVVVQKKKPTKALGRQCCTVTEQVNGVSFSMRACSGWFLSNDGEALERACEKARAGMKGFIH